MDVYLVQHGVACAKDQDPQRPLNEQGRADVARMAGYLASRGAGLIDPPIARVGHSGKLRASQTAEILAKAVCPRIEPAAGDAMGPNDDPRTVCDEVLAARDQSGGILLVGHLPHLSRLAGLLLTDDAEKSPVRFANAAVLKLRPEGETWTVAWYLTPDCVP